MFRETTANGAKTNLTRLHGRCAKGEHLRAQAPFGKWQTPTFIAGLTLQVIVAPLVIQGAMNGTVFDAFLSQVQDGNGRFFVPREVAAELSAAAGAPMYGVYDTYLGHGIVGGFLDTFEATGAKVGEIVRSLLDGKRPADIHPSRSPTYIVDWRELDRWNLDPGRLPPGAEVRYRPPSHLGAAS